MTRGTSARRRSESVVRRLPDGDGFVVGPVGRGSGRGRRVGLDVSSAAVWTGLSDFGVWVVDSRSWALRFAGDMDALRVAVGVAEADPSRWGVDAAVLAAGDALRRVGAVEADPVAGWHRAVGVARVVLDWRRGARRHGSWGDGWDADVVASLDTALWFLWRGYFPAEP